MRPAITPRPSCRRTARGRTPLDAVTVTGSTANRAVLFSGITVVLSLSGLLRSYGFRPSRVPDFAWNWLGRFVFFLGLSVTTSFSTFFYAQRLHVTVAEVVTFIAATSAKICADARHAGTPPSPIPAQAA